MCVSSLLIDEIKRIIKTSEIMKYAHCRRPFIEVDRLELRADSRTEKMIANGPKRIRMGVRSWRYAWVASIYLLR